MRPVITLLTDFGTADSYVAEMKAALLAFVPDATLIDVTHEVPPQDVTRARLLLERYWRRFPHGTVHLVVVDPGVGSARRAVAVESGHYRLVGPDNGVLTPALVGDDIRVVSLPTPDGASATFHGRDVLAPAAAALALGTPVEQLGEVVETPCVTPSPEPRVGADGTIRGEILTFDRFGNAITNITLHESMARGELRIGTRTVPLLRTYADAGRGEPLALVGSSGLVEIAVRDGHAARALALTVGAPVWMRPHPVADGPLITLDDADDAGV